jgi:hypothetical protein
MLQLNHAELKDALISQTILGAIVLNICLKNTRERIPIDYLLQNGVMIAFGIGDAISI